MRMLSSLKNHPFAVESVFDTSLVLTYAAPKQQLQKFLPPCLTLDTFDDKWAFLALAMVQTRDLRPKGFPAFTGSDFILTGYRIFVRYLTSEGKRLRGLYIIRSETNKQRMTVFGNIFTHYNYTTTDISFNKSHDLLEVKSVKSNLNVAIRRSNGAVSLPEASPFRDWKEARRFAGPLPFTFNYNDDSQVLIIEGVRSSWSPRPVEVIESRSGFVESLQLQDLVLANAFIIENVPYYWKKGKTDLWKQT
jgi:uncharacterized protein YqjF (DUF2071 family)